MISTCILHGTTSRDVTVRSGGCTHMTLIFFPPGTTDTFVKTAGLDYKPFLTKFLKVQYLHITFLCWSYLALYYSHNTFLRELSRMYL